MHWEDSIESSDNNELTKDLFKPSLQNKKDTNDINHAIITSDNETGNKSLQNNYIERLESFSYEKGTIINDHCILRVCSSSTGCPRSIFNIITLRDRLYTKINELALENFIYHDENNNVPHYKRFKIAIAGCPNACSQPQISDFGVIARAIPEYIPDNCIGCGKCISSCIEESIEIIDNEPSIDYISCVSCMDCVRSCPTDSIQSNRKGYSVKIGGRLGRHPQLAQEIVHLANEDEVELALATCLDLYMTKGTYGEQFSYTVNRLGIEIFIEAVATALVKYRDRFKSSKKKIHYAL